MYFAKIIAIAFAATAMACKCGDRSRTKACCDGLSGEYVGNDCKASSISEHLSNFRSCCLGKSDCDYPHKREDELFENKRDETTTVTPVVTRIAGRSKVVTYVA